MSAWSNIEVSPDDPEVIQIDHFEKTLKKIPSSAQQIRELITRFEVCHFKYQQHIKKIKEAILYNKIHIDPEEIGKNHLRNGVDAWKKDKTGRSLLGQRFVWTLNKWLGEIPNAEEASRNNIKPDQRIARWLGEKEPEKERLVRLLIARLKWDWKSYEELTSGKENKELENQVCRMDVCHYNFPENLNSLLRGIGKLKPIKAFEGCGSFNAEMKSFVEREFSMLIDILNSISAKKKPAKPGLIKAWLIACLAKTLKEQVGLKRTVNV